MNRTRRIISLCTLLFALGLIGACAGDPVQPQFVPTDSAMPFTEVTQHGSGDQTVVTGVIGGRNHYEIVVPEAWNGELVLYAHGFVDSTEPIQLPDKDNIEQIREGIVGMGFAFASCSFRENGLAVKDGGRSVRQVHQIFRSKVKQEPVYTWLMGMSLGGLVAVDLAENHPDEFDGIVTAAGMIGGTRAQIDYVADVRLLYDLLYAQAPLPGSVIEPVVISNLEAQVIYPVVGAVTADPTGLGILSQLVPLPGRNGDELVESLLTSIVFNYRGIDDILARTKGACPVDNQDRHYEGALPADLIGMVNANVQRYDRSVATDGFFERYYEPDGRLPVEMLALHLRHDKVVPVFHGDLYAARVASQGRAHLLEQRIVEGYGHTVEIPVAEILSAFTDLRARVVPLSSNQP